MAALRRDHGPRPTDHESESTTPPRPKVSIGLPVYNGERFLAEALDCLLAQTFADFEIVVSDNASTDATPRICREYAARDPRIRYHRTEVNVGAARNFNRTFELAQGEYFRWHAADDLCEPTLLERCVAALDRCPDAVLAYPLARCFEADGRILHSYERSLHHGAWSADRTDRFRQLAEEFWYSGGVTAPVYLFGVMRADGLRQTRLHGSYVASDWILLAELSLVGRWIELPEYLTLVRAHPGSSSMGAARGQWTVVASFFDPAAQGRTRVMVSTGRRFAEYFVVVARARLRPAEKAALLVYTALLTLRRARRRVGWWLRGMPPPIEPISTSP